MYVHAAMKASSKIDLSLPEQLRDPGQSGILQVDPVHPGLQPHRCSSLQKPLPLQSFGQSGDSQNGPEYEVEAHSHSPDLHTPFPEHNELHSKPV